MVSYDFLFTSVQTISLVEFSVQMLSIIEYLFFGIRCLIGWKSFFFFSSDLFILRSKLSITSNFVLIVYIWKKYSGNLNVTRANNSIIASRWLKPLGKQPKREFHREFHYRRIFHEREIDGLMSSIIRILENHDGTMVTLRIPALPDFLAVLIGCHISWSTLAL